MTESLNFSAEAPTSGLNQVANMVADTMANLIAVLDRTIDSVGKFAVGVAKKIKKLGEQFKNFFLADKEIILHRQARLIANEIYKGVTSEDPAFDGKGKEMYGILQEIKDHFQARMAFNNYENSYMRDYAWLYTEDVEPVVNKTMDSLWTA